VHVWSRWACNDGHFTLDGRTGFLSYLALHDSGVTKTSHMALAAHAAEALQVYFDIGQ
jgi:hypothetical protein